MAQHVLIPVDKSDQAMKALEFAFETFPDATFTALHVIIPAGSIEEGFEYKDVLEEGEERGEAILDRAREKAAEADVDLETKTVVGRTAREILDFVEENDVDQVVIGSHGRSGPARVLLGSVAETVSRRSPVPVSIVR